MLKRDFIAMLQSHAARAAIGGSTVRGKSNKGVEEKAREFLRNMDLAPFGTSNEQAFKSALDRNTEALRCHLPRGAQHWGVARKALNIYLRNCLYTCYLRETFGLDKADRLYKTERLARIPRRYRTSAERCSSRSKQISNPSSGSRFILRQVSTANVSMSHIPALEPTNGAASACHTTGGSRPQQDCGYPRCT